jgi:hypothetical protein
VDKKYQWAIRDQFGSFVADTHTGPGFDYTAFLDGAALWPTAQSAADRLALRQTRHGWGTFVLVPVRIIEETVTETITKVVGTKRSLS